MKKLFYSIILAFIAIPIIAQENSDTEHSQNLPHEDHNQYQRNLVHQKQEEITTLIIPQFSLDYIHGNVLKSRGITNQNNSNYIQFSATMKTGT